jgi:hypothetical protein
MRSSWVRVLASALLLALAGMACNTTAPHQPVALKPARPHRHSLAQAQAVPAPSDEPVTIPPAVPPSSTAALAPPQFVVISFDGGGSVELWRHWRQVASRNHAHFTFFLSGVYLLTPVNRADYHPPRHPAGASDIYYLPSVAGTEPADNLRELLAQISSGYREGNEIATHYDGHFCTGRPGNVNTWSAEDWVQELDQFSSLLMNVSVNNSLEPPVHLPFSPSEVVGSRTPCLEGNLRILYPVLAQRGFRYDASRTAEEGEWPRRIDGLWSFPLASIPLSGHRLRVLSMDYNLYANQSGAHDVSSDREPIIEQQAYETFKGYFERAYHGNRAPVSIGAHFKRWSGSAYVNAITRFADDVCTQAEVRCVSYRELADWLDAQSPAQLATLGVGSRPTSPSGSAAAP